MKIAVMQPYVFPYLGYFQLINYTDKFVFYDDVDFMRRGWVNRNQILANKGPVVFTLPVEKASSYTLIKNIKIHSEEYTKWKRKFFQTLEQNYKNSPYFEVVYPLITEALKDQLNISELAINSVKLVSKYLNLETRFLISSESFSNFNKYDRADRLIEITKNLDGDIYVNMIGGMDLYSKKDFEEKGMKLEFLKPQLLKYKQGRDEFHSGLSIIDVMMNCSKKEIHYLLNQFEII